MTKKNDGDILKRNGPSVHSSNPCFSRREFLFMGGIIFTAATASQCWSSGNSSLIIIEQANGLVVGDPSKCVGCRRCELACSEFNDGKASPVISRIKISRNLNPWISNPGVKQFGPGTFGNGLVIQDLCKQCPHPVPCANACPHNAIVLAPNTKARVVDSAKCVGCKICQRACPWDMISFDPDTNRATKCFLCNGNPKCVAACPAEALKYVPWCDLTKIERPRISPNTFISPSKASTCIECH
ncbi:MAG: 4Fe-4S dicluster domain-containing protein [Syntrophaceae bacterium]|nr:4Fe-4S dicluster domain-containing protein [Syntrophaceae bacterium]